MGIVQASMGRRFFEAVIANEVEPSKDKAHGFINGPPVRINTLRKGIIDP